MPRYRYCVCRLSFSQKHRMFQSSGSAWWIRLYDPWLSVASVPLKRICCHSQRTQTLRRARCSFSHETPRECTPDAASFLMAGKAQWSRVCDATLDHLLLLCSGALGQRRRLRDVVELRDREIRDVKSSRSILDEA